MNEIDSVKLSAFLRRWVINHPTWRQLPADVIAADLVADADFEVIKLAGWMQTPDGALITQIVQSVLPSPYDYGAAVLAEAIRIAARKRTVREQNLTLVGGLGAAVLVVLLFSKS